MVVIRVTSALIELCSELMLLARVGLTVASSMSETTCLAAAAAELFTSVNARQ